MADDSKIVVTLKADGNAPWIVVRGDTPEETSALLNSIGETGLIGTVVIAQQELHGVFAANVGVGAQPTQVVTTPQAPPTSPAPSSPAPQAQAAPAPVCQHGPRVYKTSKPGAEKTWAAWMCPAPKGDPTQCSPQWIR